MKKPEVTLHRRKIDNPYRYNRYPINFSTRVETTIHSKLSNLSSNRLSPLFFFFFSSPWTKILFSTWFSTTLRSIYSKTVHRFVERFEHFSIFRAPQVGLPLKKKSVRLLHHRGTNKLVHLLCECMDEKILRSSTLVEIHRGKCNLVENFRDWEKRLSEF